jgi:hypothetical protein
MSYTLGPEYSAWTDVATIFVVIGAVLGLIYWIYQFKLYKFFSQFEGDFEKHFGKGFLILFSLGILSIVFRGIRFVFDIYLHRRYTISEYTKIGIPLSMLYDGIVGVLFGVASLYAIYLMFKGTRYYKK